jgi:curved DNA-binding protein CbpA
MTSNADPWRTLGLNPGASIDDIRRAYRRLAKANHPDTAGETAVPRFLAIQSAYEQLLGPSARRRPGSRPSRSAPAPPAEPWQADPDRARASGRADGRRPGARPTGRPGPAADAGAGAAAGSTDEAPQAGSTRSRRSTGRRRAPNKATPYSTSYDAVDEEPFEPGWSGATWYGASSGTYWTINPKEYADPRKHGPEYQRRARRGANGWVLDDATDDARPVDGADPGADAPSDHGPAAAPDRPAAPTWTDARAGSPPPRPAASTAAAAGAGAGARGAESPSGAGVESSAPPPADRRTWVDQPPPDRPFRGPYLRLPTTPAGRLAIALLGWPPLALAASVGIGEQTGCGRFAASCGELSSPGTWVVDLALLVLLLALPRLALWTAHGTIATVVLGLPAAILLSAGGGAREPEASAAVLTTVIVLGWAAGVVYAMVVPRLGSSRATYHERDEPPPRQP